MKNYIIAGLLLITGFFLSTCGVAQDATVIKVDGVKYVMHEVNKGQTLYAISKKYAVSIADIYKANPALQSEGLKIGQNLRIPQKRINKKELKRSEITIKGDTLIHKVLKQETLYSLSKKYAIGIDQLNAINTGIEKEGLKVGMEIKIPIKQTTDAEANELVSANEDSLLLHTIAPKETLYALSKLYNVTIDSIQLVNNGLPDGLKVGTSVRIPKPNPNFTSTAQANTSKVVDDSLSQLTVSFLLPFYLNVNDTIDTLKNSLRPIIYSKSTLALNFYQGALLALDSLKNEGVSCDVHFFDTENNANRVKELATNDTVEHSNLIIGPFYRSNFKVISQTARENVIPIVSPVKLSNKVLLSNPTAVKVYSNNAAHIINMAKYIYQHYADSNVILMNTAHYKDRNALDLFKKHINKWRADKQRDTLPQIDIYTFKKERIAPLLQDSTHYVFVLPSKEQVWVTQFLTYLNDVYRAGRGIEFTVFGLEKWLSYDNLNTTMLQNLNVHFNSSRYINYQDPKVIDLTKKYRHVYHTDLDEFSLLGFDVTYYFVKKLHQKRKQFITSLPEVNDSMLSTRYNFIQLGEESGFENKSSFIFKIENYQYKVVW